MPMSFRPQIVAACVGLALLLAALLFTSGAGKSGAQPQTSVAGTYVEAMVGTPRFVNPLLATSDADTDLAHLVFSGLTRVDTTGNITPDLASAWNTSPDARVYTFTLKPDLRWHDGAPLTADDALFTLELLRRPDFPGDPTLAAPWKNVDASSPTSNTLVLRLPAPDASFLQYTTLGLLPRHVWGAIKSSDLLTSGLNQSPVGSGPWRYKLEAATPGATAVAGSAGASASTPQTVGGTDGVLLEPNPYMPPPNSAITRLWFRQYPTFGAALTGFSMGEAHGLGHIPPERAADVAAIQGVDLHRQPLARYTMLLLNVRSPLFDKADTRRAIELAIDRAAIVQSSLGGDAQSLVSPILPQSWAYDPTQKAIYDPAQARQLLDAAGWRVGKNGVRVRDGTPLSLVLAANADMPSNVAVARQIQAFLGAVGVDVKLAMVGREQLLRDYLAPRAFHMALAGWDAAGADPDVAGYWHSRGNIVGGLNVSGWSNPDADKALDAALATPDQTARKANYIAFQKAFASDVPAVVLYAPLYTYATRPPASNVTLPTASLLTPALRFDTLNAWALQPIPLP